MDNTELAGLVEMIRAQTIMLMRIYDVLLTDLYEKDSEKAKKIKDLHDSGRVLNDTVKYVEAE